MARYAVEVVVGEPRAARNDEQGFFRRSLTRPLPSRSLYTIPLASLQAAKDASAHFQQTLHSVLPEKRFPLRLARRLDPSVQFRKCSNPIPANLPLKMP